MPENLNRLLSLLSLCQKAGRLVSGEESCERALQSGSARLVLVCRDASDNTKRKFSQKTFYYHKPYYEALTKDSLNQAIGKQNRATIAITDEGFAKSIGALLGPLTKENAKTPSTVKEKENRMD